jgi:hypothetical protein
MSEKDVIYAVKLLHTVQIKREAISFAETVCNTFNNLNKEQKNKVWYQYLKEELNENSNKKNAHEKS